MAEEIRYSFTVHHPVNEDAVLFFLRRYWWDDLQGGWVQEYWRDGWMVFPEGGVSEPCLKLSGLDLARMRPDGLTVLIEEKLAERQHLVKLLRETVLSVVADRG